MKASCTIGDGPNIIVSLDGKELLLLEEPNRTNFKSGVVEHGQIELSVEEARNLVISLLSAIKQVQDFEEMGEEYERI